MAYKISLTRQVYFYMTNVKMKILIMGGVPASGKSSIMKKVISILGQKGKQTPFISMGVKGLLFSKQKVLILGDYEREEFPGTDTFAMNIQPKVIELIHSMKNEQISVCFEGDRLFNTSFIHAIKKMDIPYQIMILNVDKAVLEQRRKSRKSTQDDVWLRGRKSKVKNIMNDLGLNVLLVPNNNEEQFELAVGEVFSFIKSFHAVNSTILKFI